MNKLLIIVVLVLVGIIIGGDIGPAMVGLIIVGLMFYGMYKFIVAVIQSGIETLKKGPIDKDELMKAGSKGFFEFIRRAIPYLFKWH